MASYSLFCLIPNATETAGAYHTLGLLPVLLVFLPEVVWMASARIGPALSVDAPPCRVFGLGCSIHANPLTTPAHIVPEWYFLALYAILRSIPNKQAGVVAVALVIFTLILLGWGSMVSKNRCVTGLVLELNGCEERHCACPIRF